MKLAWMGVALCFFFLGCDSQRRCDVDRNCLGGEQCTMGVCVPVATDGGTATGGGSATGGGAATGGGSATGGGTATGGGGAVSACSTCPVGYSCDPGGAVCVRRLGAIAIDAPLPNARFNQTSVTLTAHLTTNGEATLPDQLDLFLDNAASVPATRNGTSYSATLANLVEGPHVIRLSVQLFDVLLSSAEVQFTIDTTAPTLAPSSALPRTPLARDELFVLGLNANESLRPTATQVTLGDVSMQPSTSPCGGDAGCWTLDMSLPALNSLEGNFTIIATTTDVAGNRLTADAGTIRITRKRWEVTPSNLGILASPAIGRDGTVYLGVTNSLRGGMLIALDPTTGSQTASASVGSVMSVATGVSSGTDIVYFSANDSNGAVVGGRTATLDAGIISGGLRGNPLGSTYSALALVVKSSGEVGALAAFNSTQDAAGMIGVYWPRDISRLNINTVSPRDILDFGTVPGRARPINNIVINAAVAFLTTRQVGSGLSIVPAFGVDSTTPTPGAPIDLEPRSLILDCCFAGQMAHGTGAFVSGTLMARKSYAVETSSITGSISGPNSDYGVPAHSVTRGFMGRGNELLVFNTSSLSTAPLVLKANAGPIRTSPVLGAARAGQPPLGYAVNEWGALFVFDQGSNVADSALDFGPIFAGNQQIEAHPTLDCNRRAGAATSTTGVLYVATDDGRVAAIIIDSPRLLDTPNAWPKYQRTAGNAGNTDTRFPLNPGCPGN